MLRINLATLILVIDELMTLACDMISIPKNLKGSEILQIPDAYT